MNDCIKAVSFWFFRLFPFEERANACASKIVVVIIVVIVQTGYTIKLYLTVNIFEFHASDCLNGQVQMSLLKIIFKIYSSEQSLRGFTTY
jgi:hypothetical protein